MVVLAVGREPGPGWWVWWSRSSPLEGIVSAGSRVADRRRQGWPGPTPWLPKLSRGQRHRITRKPSCRRPRRADIEPEAPERGRVYSGCAGIQCTGSFNLPQSTYIWYPCSEFTHRLGPSALRRISSLEFTRHPRGQQGASGSRTGVQVGVDSRTQEPLRQYVRANKKRGRS